MAHGEASACVDVAQITTADALDPAAGRLSDIRWFNPPFPPPTFDLNNVVRSISAAISEAHYPSFSSVAEASWHVTGDTVASKDYLQP